MAVVPYTSTYTDIDTNIFDSDDLVNEFFRVAEFMNAWSQSIDSIGTVNVFTKNITIVNNIIAVAPLDGLIQSMIIADDVENIVVDFTEREEGETYRIYLTLRFQSKSTTFTVSGPAGTTHIFGLNAESFSPSQVSADGYFTAMVIATYGTNGMMINVFADNSESASVSGNDIQSVVAK